MSITKEGIEGEPLARLHLKSFGFKEIENFEEVEVLKKLRTLKKLRI